ncbi:MAG: CRISPR-associated endonuclease Cas2 [Halothiobacillaceae bacterium]
MMMVLITYDVSTSDEGGRRRLRKVAGLCQDYAQRVQLSVFECWIDPAQWPRLRKSLIETIDVNTDSIRFYFLGDNWHNRIEHHGAKRGYNPTGPLIA